MAILGGDTLKLEQIWRDARGNNTGEMPALAEARRCVGGCEHALVEKQNLVPWFLGGHNPPQAEHWRRKNEFRG